MAQSRLDDFNNKLQDLAGSELESDKSIYNQVEELKKLISTASDHNIQNLKINNILQALLDPRLLNINEIAFILPNLTTHPVFYTHKCIKEYANCINNLNELYLQTQQNDQSVTQYPSCTPPENISEKALNIYDKLRCHAIELISKGTYDIKELHDVTITIYKFNEYLQHPYEEEKLNQLRLDCESKQNYPWINAIKDFLIAVVKCCFDETRSNKFKDNLFSSKEKIYISIINELTPKDSPNNANNNPPSSAII